MRISELLKPVVESICSAGFAGMSEPEVIEFLANHQNPSSFHAFQRRCFSGWKSAQKSILQEQLLLTERFPNISKESFGLYLLRSYQRLQDTIIWSLTCEDLYEAKRVFAPSPIVSDLRKHNIETHVNVANIFNDSPDKCAIITDLSSGTKIGDLVLAEVGKQSSFCEIKSGGGGELVKMIFDKDLSEQDRKKIARQFATPSKMKEVERFFRQTENAFETHKLLKGDPGVDKRMSPTQIQRILYSSTLNKQNEVVDQLLVSLDQKEAHFSVELVDECVLLVALNLTSMTNRGGEDIYARVEDIAKQFFKSDIPLVLADWSMFLHNTSFTRPIYLHGLEVANIDNLIDRRKALFVCLSLEHFLKKFDGQACKIQVLTKENLKSKHWRPLKVGYGFEHKGYSIGFENDGRRVLLSQGLFQRFLSELLSPSDLFFLHLQMLKRQQPGP